jgi:hypothetical protein
MARRSGAVDRRDVHGGRPERVVPVADVLLTLLPHRWKQSFGPGFIVERVVTPIDAT